MKKNFIFLFFIIIGLRSNAQTTYTIINSPDTVIYQAISNAIAPNGTTIHSTFNGVYFVDGADLFAIPSASLDISAFGFAYTNSCLTLPASGTLEVFMCNTSDITYSKGGSWSVAISGMTQVYNGMFNIPTGTVATTSDVYFPSNFNYSGGALYVAFSYTGSTFDTTFNSYATYKGTYVPSTPNTTLGVFGDSYFFTDLNNMKKTIMRPVFRFGLAHPAPTTSLKENSDEEMTSVYPNPCFDQITIHAYLNISGLKLFDICGKEIAIAPLVKAVNEKEYSISTKELNVGIYFLEIKQGDLLSKKKIMVVK